MPIPIDIAVLYYARHPDAIIPVEFLHSYVASARPPDVTIPIEYLHSYEASTPTPHVADIPGEALLVTEEYTIAAGSDDATRRLTPSSFSVTSTYGYVGRSSSSYRQFGVGIRFSGVDIPKGVTIIEAFLHVKCSVGSVDGIPPYGTKLRGEDADDPDAFSNAANFDGRPRTTAEVSWAPGVWTPDVWYTSPDIASVVQEIVDRSGFAESHLVIFWDDFEDEGGRLQYTYSRDHSQENAPYLQVTYEPEIRLIEYAASAKISPKGETYVLDLPVALGRIPSSGEGPTAEFGGAWGRIPQLGVFTVLLDLLVLVRRPESGEFQILDLPSALSRKPEALKAIEYLHTYTTRTVKTDVEQDLDCVGDLYVYASEAATPDAEASITDCGVDAPEASVFVQTHHRQPSDDCAVLQFWATANFNGNPQQQLRITYWEGENAYTYLKFDVSGYPTITLAKLRLYCRAWGSYEATLTKKVYKVSVDTWTEEKITWNNKPAVGDEVASVTQGGEGWHEWDITDHVEAERQVDGIVSLCIKMYDKNHYVSFHDKENAPFDKKPELYLEY